MSHDSEAVCECVKTHVPKVEEFDLHHIFSLGRGGKDVVSNRVWLCPTGHRNIHTWERPWYKARRITTTRGSKNQYLWDLAVRGFNEWLATQEAA